VVTHWHEDESDVGLIPAKAASPIREGRMEGKKKRGRPRMMLLDWMMKEDYHH